MPESRFFQKRLRYVFPVGLAAMCLALGVMLTSALERSREGTEHTAAALAKVQRAAELVAELRFGSAEHLALRAVGLKDEWQRLQPTVLALAGDAPYGKAALSEQVRVTAALFDSALLVSSPPPGKTAEDTAHEISLASSAVWAGWHRAEGVIARRLVVEVNGPGNQSAAVLLLAALGCFCCSLLLWQSWHSNQVRTEAAAMEAQWRDSDSRYRAMADSAYEILIQADPAGKILRSNRRLAAATMGSLFDSPDVWSRLLENLRRANGQTPLNAREAWLSAPDSGRLVECRVTPVRDASGSLVRVDSALLDITSWYSERQAAQTRTAVLEQNQRKLQVQLRELLEQSFELAESRASFKRAAESRGQALLTWGSRVAEPLRQAAAVAARLRGGSAPLAPAEAGALVNAVDTVVSSLQALAEFAGLDRGPLDLVPAPFAPHELLEDCLAAVAERAEIKHLQLPCFVQQSVPTRVLADARRLREALAHILEHAIAHTGCGEVSARLTVAGQSQGSVNLRFEIEDTGAGCNAEELAALLEPFHPAVAPPAVASRLALAKKLVERLGGQFGAESEPRQGTRIWFLLPAEIERAPGEVVDGSEQTWLAPELVGKRVLIVVDAASQRGALVELAQTLGLAANSCATTDEAQAILLREGAEESQPFHFVLLDYDVPSAGLLGDPRLTGTPIYLIVPHSLRTLSLEVCPVGLSGLIPRPVRRASLASLLCGKPLPVSDESSRSRGAGLAGLNGSRGEFDRPSDAGAPIVLVVEDNLVNQRVAVRLVEKMGYRTAVVNNGLEAIRAVTQQHFDLVLMDCQMPELDGFTATAEIRRLELAGAHLPIIAMTANAMRGDREKCLASGMDDYISKPVAFEDLRVLVTRWLARAEATRH